MENNDNNNANRPPRSRNRRRRGGGGGGQQRGPAPEGQQAPRRPQQAAQPNRNNNNNNNQRPRRNGGDRPRQPQNQGPRVEGFERIERNYLNLLDKHLEARKKYFDLFHRADKNQLRKLSDAFHNSAVELTNYGDKLPPEFRERFEKRFNGLTPDLTYAINHELPPEAEPVSAEGHFEDPHRLRSQIEGNFSDDTEESVGTIDDYLRVKGLPPRPITN
jgi:hypothetical protein